MDRLDILKEQLFREFYVKKEWWGDDLSVLHDPAVAGLPLIMRKAAAFDLVCREMPIELKKHELIVGITTMSSVGFGHTFPRYETDEEAARFASLSLDRKSVWGHHLPYYPKVLSKGYNGIIADIDRALEKPLAEIERLKVAGRAENGADGAGTDGTARADATGGAGTDTVAGGTGADGIARANIADSAEAGGVAACIADGARANTVADGAGADGVAACIADGAGTDGTARADATGGARSPREEADFLLAAKSTLESASRLSLRYAALVSEAAEAETDPVRRAELAEIARICAKVPMEPAETFQEALQSVWFVHMLLHSTLSYTPLGRVDQYLWPYYKRDADMGAIGWDRAEELIGSFLVKFNERTQFLKEHMENHMWAGDWSQGGDPNEPTTTFDMENDADYTYGQSANHWLQSAVVGGLGPDGEDATNDLSFLFIKAINRLELVSPMMGARLHAKSPKEFLRFVSSELCQGGAQPVLFNDDVIVKGMSERLRIPVEDARDYASDGCWETLVYGKTEYSYGHIELMPCMEALLNGGKSMVSGRMIGADPGDIFDGTLDTFDGFYEAYMRQVRYRIASAIQNKIRYYDEVHKIAPEPYLSALVDDCVANRRDMTDRGARYRIYSLFATGLSHCVDALCAIRRLVYDEGLVTLEDAVDALSGNWEGYEELRQSCLLIAPKYGNDDDEADAMLTRFLKDFADEADAWNRKVDWIEISAGIATFENYPRFGHNAWASFDGRMAHEAFSSNYSPAVGRDRQGPTAVLLSATKFDLARLNSGCPVDLRVSFNKETLDENAAIMQGFIESFVALGGNIMTITKVDYATLKKAQEEPEKYMSLRVRLGGVTAYFTQLAKPQQDEYMRRTEHAM